MHKKKFDNIKLSKDDYDICVRLEQVYYSIVNFVMDVKYLDKLDRKDKFIL